MYIYIYTYIYTYIYIYIHIMYTLCVHIHIYFCVCICVCAYVYIYIHINIHMYLIWYYPACPSRGINSEPLGPLRWRNSTQNWEMKSGGQIYATLNTLLSTNIVRENHPKASISYRSLKKKSRSTIDGQMIKIFNEQDFPPVNQFGSLIQLVSNQPPRGSSC